MINFLAIRVVILQLSVLSDSWLSGLSVFQLSGLPVLQQKRVVSSLAIMYVSSYAFRVIGSLLLFVIDGETNRKVLNMGTVRSKVVWFSRRFLGTEVVF